MQEIHADISLRDLYLILRRGFPLIAVAALLAGAAAFVITSILPKSYRSTSVVQVIPSPIGEQQIGGLDFNPRSNLSFEAYRSIALDTKVLQQTLDTLEGGDLGLSGLKQRIELRRLAGPDNPNQIAPLAVEHLVSDEDPDLVLRIASAWSQASLDAVRATLTASLTAMADTTSQALQRRQRAVDEGEAAWQAFQAGDNRDAIRLRLADVNTRFTESSARIDQLGRLIAVARARQAFLADQLEAATPGTALDTGAQLSALVENRLLSSEVATQLRVLLAEQPDFAQDAEQDLLLLLLRAELQQVTTALVGQLAERDFILGEAAALEAQAETLRARLAELEREATTLERELEAARMAYQSVVDIAPVIEYAGELVSTSASLLSAPNVAPDSIGRGRMANTVVSALLAAVLAVLYLFLREAIRDPEARADLRQSAAP